MRLGLSLGLGASRSASAPAWSPADVSSLAGWYKGDAGYVAGVSWADQSGAGNHLTCTGSVAGVGQNGRGTVLFDGVDDVAWRAVMTMAIASGLTVAIIMKRIANGAFPGFWGYDANHHQLLGNSTGAGDAAKYTASTNTNYTAAAGPVLGAFHRLVTTSDNATSLLYLDGTVTGAGGTADNTVATGQEFAVGARAGSLGAGLPSNIDVAEVCFFGSVLSAPDLALLDAYAVAAWAI